MTEQSKDLVVVDEAYLDIYREGDAAVEGPEGEVVLSVLKMGGAGAANFVDEEGKPVVSVRGVVVISLEGRTYWERAYGQGPTGPPDCESLDGKTGDGNPGGACKMCPQNQWPGSGGGKPCTEVRRLIILTEDQEAILLRVKPGSLWNWDKYMTTMRSKGWRYWGVETELTARRATNKANVAYAQVVPMVIRRLTPEQTADIAKQRSQWEDFLMRTSVGEYEDVAEGDLMAGVEGEDNVGYTIS